MRCAVLVVEVVIGLRHPVNPPYLIPLVEICPTEWTSEHTVDRCCTLMAEMAKHRYVSSGKFEGLY